MLVFIAFTLSFVVVVLLRFPRRLAFLPDRVRFPSGRRSSVTSTMESRRDRFMIWFSGTMRTAVQSAIIPVIALSMRDARWTGNYRQTFAVAAVSLLPMPVEALMSKSCCLHRIHDAAYSSKMASGFIGAVALLVAGVEPPSAAGEDGEILTLMLRIFELGILMIALGLAAPFNASKLYEQRDAERTIVILEWLKAYVGRVLGPITVVGMYSFVGYGPVLLALSAATAAVTFTA